MSEGGKKGGGDHKSEEYRKIKSVHQADSVDSGQDAPQQSIPCWLSNINKPKTNTSKQWYLIFLEKYQKRK